jgi:hypothetical protein
VNRVLDFGGGDTVKLDRDLTELLDRAEATGSLVLDMAALAAVRQKMKLFGDRQAIESGIKRQIAEQSQAGRRIKELTERAAMVKTAVESKNWAPVHWCVQGSAMPLRSFAEACLKDLGRVVAPIYPIPSHRSQNELLQVWRWTEGREHPDYSHATSAVSLMSGENLHGGMFVTNWDMVTDRVLRERFAELRTVAYRNLVKWRARQKKARP